MNELQLSVAARVAQLPSLPIKEIWVLWDRYFQRRPDKPNRDYLESRLAYKLQEEAFAAFDCAACKSDSPSARLPMRFAPGSIRVPVATESLARAVDRLRCAPSRLARAPTPVPYPLQPFVP